MKQHKITHSVESTETTFNNSIRSSTTQEAWTRSDSRSMKEISQTVNNIDFVLKEKCTDDMEDDIPGLEVGIANLRLSDPCPAEIIDMGINTPGLLISYIPNTTTTNLTVKPTLSMTLLSSSGPCKISTTSPSHMPTRSMSRKRPREAQVKRRFSVKNNTLYKRRVIYCSEYEYYGAHGQYRQWPAYHGEDCHDPHCNSYAIHDTDCLVEPRTGPDIKVQVPTDTDNKRIKRRGFPLVGTETQTAKLKEILDTSDMDLRIESAYNRKQRMSEDQNNEDMPDANAKTVTKRVEPENAWLLQHCVQFEQSTRNIHTQSVQCKEHIHTQRRPITHSEKKQTGLDLEGVETKPNPPVLTKPPKTKPTINFFEHV